MTMRLLTVLPLLTLPNTFAFVPLAFTRLLAQQKQSCKIRPRNVASIDPPNQLNQDASSVSEILGFEEEEPSTTQMSWSKQWYPLAVEEFTTKNKTTPLTLLGNDVVLWYNGQQWSVLEDSCPHRGVPLSEGRVESNGELLCTYHAWTFNSKGECTKIPQTNNVANTQDILSHACVKAYPTQVKQGLIWVWGEKGAPGRDVAIQAALKQPGLVEELEDASLMARCDPIKWGFRDLPYGWDAFVENVADAAHASVSHHNIVGNRYTGPAPLVMRRVQSISEVPYSQGGQFNERYPEDRGFSYSVENKNEKDKPNGGMATVDIRPPTLVRIVSPFVNSTACSILALYATPTKPGYCRNIGAQILVRAEDGKKPASITGVPTWLPSWFLHVTASLFLVNYT